MGILRRDPLRRVHSSCIGLGIELKADGTLTTDARACGLSASCETSVPSDKRTGCSEPMQPASSKRRVKSIVTYPAPQYRIFPTVPGPGIRDFVCLEEGHPLA